MLRCVIIDDEPSAIKVLKKHIEKHPNLEYSGSETNPLLGIEMIKAVKPHIIFLDIQMEEMSGLDVMNIIGNTAQVILCTAYSEFAVKSYELNAVDYLMKPIEFNRFAKAVQKVIDASSNQASAVLEGIPNDYIFVKAGQRGKMLKIDLDDIDYIEAMNNYIGFHRAAQKTLAYLSMREIEDRLPASKFMRVHKSFIIALKQISSIENNQIILKPNLKHIPIGTNYKDEFFEKMKNKLMD